MDVELSEQMQAIDEEPVFVQWVADNVDHKTVALLGKGTFHGMGIVSTSSKPLQGRFGNIPRLEQQKKGGSFTEKGGVEIIPVLMFRDWPGKAKTFAYFGTKLSNNLTYGNKLRLHLALWLVFYLQQ